MKKNSMVGRRSLLKLGAVALGTGVVAKVTNSQANPVMKTETMIAFEQLSPDATPDQILNELMTGNKRFVDNKPESPNQDPQRIKEVSQKQTPSVSILGCSDSRVPLEIIFDRGVGDIFVVRDAGNIATPEEIGSLEFGTLVLGTRVLMVLGHEKCGAVQAAIANKPLPGQIGSIVAAIQPGIDRTNQNDSEEFFVETIKRNVMFQIKKLENSSVLQDLVKQGKLKIVGAYYSLKTGEVILLS